MTDSSLVRLQPMAMVIPNRECIYSPSQLAPPIEIDRETFKIEFAKRPRRLRACLDESPTPKTIVERSELVTVYYGKGLSYWYSVVE